MKTALLVFASAGLLIWGILPANENPTVLIKNDTHKNQVSIFSNSKASGEIPIEYKTGDLILGTLQGSSNKNDGRGKPEVDREDRKIEDESETKKSVAEGGVVLNGENSRTEPIGVDRGEILRKVYQLESSSGKNDGCRNRGLFNGYGFGQNKSSWNCFETFEEVTGKVDAWFENHLQTKSLPEALCYYNEGIVRSDCPYYTQKYLALK